MIFIGKICKRGDGPKVLSNELPPHITEIDGEYYMDGKKLEMKSCNLLEFFEKDKGKEND